MPVTVKTKRSGRLSRGAKRSRRKRTTTFDPINALNQSFINVGIASISKGTYFVPKKALAFADFSRHCKLLHKNKHLQRTEFMVRLRFPIISMAFITSTMVGRFVDSTRVDLTRPLYWNQTSNFNFWGLPKPISTLSGTPTNRRTILRIATKNYCHVSTH